jgi:hypothetical protein
MAEAGIEVELYPAICTGIDPYGVPGIDITRATALAYSSILASAEPMAPPAHTSIVA